MGNYAINGFGHFRVAGCAQELCILGFGIVLRAHVERHRAGVIIVRLQELGHVECDALLHIGEHSRAELVERFLHVFRRGITRLKCRDNLVPERVPEVPQV